VERLWNTNAIDELEKRMRRVYLALWSVEMHTEDGIRTGHA
jgi:hypothetical protein